MWMLHGGHVIRAQLNGGQDVELGIGSVYGRIRAIGEGYCLGWGQGLDVKSGNKGCKSDVKWLAIDLVKGEAKIP